MVLMAEALALKQALTHTCPVLGQIVSSYPLKLSILDTSSEF